MMDKSRDGGSRSVCPTTTTYSEGSSATRKQHAWICHWSPEPNKKRAKTVFQSHNAREREKCKHRTVSYPIPIHHHSYAFSPSFLFFQILSF
ncbi:hypothetical protein VNO80_22367 [Phaseolus coccineus]|uniref:Uncharacterized protein n=1 Tax=Phaseolus coccineus TaxID=3886 RepID=A0AAN9MAC6_PHACN